MTRAATQLVDCSVVERVAVSRSARGPRQVALLAGKGRWTWSYGRTAAHESLLYRLRRVRGLLVIENNTTETVTIVGTVREDGFVRKV